MAKVVEKKPRDLIQCGVVMPISAIGDCSESHWSEILTIIADSVLPAGFEATLVSGADEVTIIQKTIIQNLYDNPIVIVDVSERNPNVMFELGIRLAFDKPTVIIKDDKTPYVFDTGVIEHIEYPRDLRFSKIVEFKRRLAEKVLATYQKQIADPKYSTFLRHFGTFKISHLENTEVSSQEFILKKLDDLEGRLIGISAPLAPSRRPISYPAGNEVDVCCGPLTENEVEQLRKRIAQNLKVSGVRVVQRGDHVHLYATADIETIANRRDLEDEFRKLARSIRGGSRVVTIDQSDVESTTPMRGRKSSVGAKARPGK